MKRNIAQCPVINIQKKIVIITYKDKLKSKFK